MAEGEARSEDVGGSQTGHVVATHVPGATDHGEDDATGENATRLESGEGKDLAGVSDEAVPLGDEHQQLRPDDSGKDKDDGEVPDLLGIHTLLPGEALDEKDGEDYAKGDEESIGRKREVTDMKELRVHVVILDVAEERNGARGEARMKRVGLTHSIGYPLPPPSCSFNGLCCAKPAKSSS